MISYIHIQNDGEAFRLLDHDVPERTACYLELIDLGACLLWDYYGQVFKVPNTRLRDLARLYRDAYPDGYDVNQRITRDEPQEAWGLLMLAMDCPAFKR